MSSFQSLVQGERTTGADVRTQNVTAVQALANIVKSSLGPVGLDKVRGGRERREQSAVGAVFFPSAQRSVSLLSHVRALTPRRALLLLLDAGRRHWRRHNH